MTNEEIFDQWCPATSRWATWAKPVLFTQFLPLEQQTSIRSEWENWNVSWAPNQGTDTAIVLDLPGTMSLLVSLALLKIGYQPVPLFNCCAAMEDEVLPTRQIREYLVHGAFDLQDMQLPPTAPPAFILDSDRLAGKNTRRPGEFDNRWMTFPQDFPSGNFLKDAGINKAILVQAVRRLPESDLTQVLMRWQDAGIPISEVDVSNPCPPVEMTVVPPPQYRWFFQRTLALMGFMLSSAGGFGSVIPQPSSGAG